MNTVERIVLRKLEEEIGKISENSSDKNETRQEHLRIFTNSAARRALEIIRALEENSEEAAHVMPKI